MKKILALILVLATIFSLTAAVSADFTDAAQIDEMNTEAVTVLSNLGILAGNPDGSFKPADILTRAQAAKIICYVLLGKDGAEALPTGTSTFSDVPASNWASKYVEYCAANGIVSGIGGGKFGPNNKLTGFAFGKMLLCGALDYNAEAEGLVGANWGTNVYNLLKENRLNLGVTVSDKDLSRENACKLALNTLFHGEEENPEGTLAYKVYGVYRVFGTADTAKHHLLTAVYTSNQEDKYWPGTDIIVEMSPFFVAENEFTVGRVVTAMLGDEPEVSEEKMQQYRNGMGWYASSFINATGLDRFEAGSTVKHFCSDRGSVTRFYYDGSSSKYYARTISYFGGLITNVQEPLKAGDTILEDGVVTLENGMSFVSNDFTAADVGTYAAYTGLGKTTYAIAVEPVEIFRCEAVKGSLLNSDNKAVRLGSKSYPTANFAAVTPESYIEAGGSTGDSVTAYIFKGHSYGLVKN